MGSWLVVLGLWALGALGTDRCVRALAYGICGCERHVLWLSDCEQAAATLCRFAEAAAEAAGATGT